MPYGYTGNILHLHLNSKKYWTENPAESFYRTYWGGRSLALNMAHIYNYRKGFTFKSDTLPEVFYYNFKGDLLNGQGAINKENFHKALRLYYESMGWGPNNGIPKPAKLTELGLDWLIDEVKR